MQVVVKLVMISYEKKNEEAFWVLTWKDLQPKYVIKWKKQGVGQCERCTTLCGKGGMVEYEYELVFTFLCMKELWEDIEKV